MADKHFINKTKKSVLISVISKISYLKTKYISSYCHSICFLISQKIDFFAITSLILIFLYFSISQINNPIIFDAQGYLDIGHSYYHNGFLKSAPDMTNLESGLRTDIRTYFYPAFLCFLYSISLITGIKEILVISISQLLLYFFSTWVLKQSISLIDKKIGKMVYITFAVNIFIFPYIVLPLTDLMSFCFFMLWLSRFILLDYYINLKDFHSAKSQILIVSLLSGVLLALRPASLWICTVSIVLFVIYFKKYLELYIYTKKKNARNSASSILEFSYVCYTIFLLIVVFFLPLIPQFYFNYYAFGVFSVFPVFDLKKLQIDAGLTHLKLAGSFIHFGIVYSSPFFKPEIHEADLLWYFKHFASSFKHVFCKLIGAFDFDRVLVYGGEQKYTLNSVRSWVTGFFSLSIFNTGIYGAISYAFYRPKFFGHRFFPLILFCVWSLFTLPTAIELRFVIPMLLVFGIMSIYQIQLFFLYDKTHKKYFVFYYLSSLAIFLPIAYFVRSTII